MTQAPDLFQLDYNYIDIDNKTDSSDCTSTDSDTYLSWLLCVFPIPFGCHS